MIQENTEAKYITVKSLLENPQIKAGDRTIEKCHLHFNGPGASGFGVKRTALLIPESVMLLAAPLCCGRHGTIAGRKSGYDERMFYLYITERDLVTGKYLQRIPEAAKRISETRKPKLIFLCMTCIDAIMGTDLQRIGRKIEESCGIKVVSCFMDPITRESRKSPMVSVQKSVFSALEKKSEKNEHAVNFLGGFVPLEKNCEAFEILKEAGVTQIREISACKDYEDFQKMSEACLNIVINPQTVSSAEDLQKKLGTDFVIFENVYGPKRIEDETKKLCEKLKNSFDYSQFKINAEKKLNSFAEKFARKSFGIGEAVNGNPFEIALTFLEKNLNVEFVFRNIITQKDFYYLEKIKELKQNLKIYSGVHPSSQNGSFTHADIVIGLDAAYFLQDSIAVNWNMEKQTLGFTGLISLLEEIEERFKNPLSHKEMMHGNYLTV